MIGGYLQGAGHSPASHDHGLGTDQVLEMKVLLASGEIVTANECQYKDLFTALRGGGGGTYGVVLSTTIKAYATQPVLGHKLSIKPLNDSLSAEVLNISANIMSKYSILSDAGFSGYAGIVQGLVYSHTLGKTIPRSNVSATIQHAESIVNKELLEGLLLYNGSLVIITSTWSRYSSFEEYRVNGGGSGQSPVGTSNIILASRMFDKKSLLSNTKSLHGMLKTIFSYPKEPALDKMITVLELFLVGGGQVLHQAPYTSVHPAWRKTYLLSEVLAVWPDNLDSQQIQVVKDDVTSKKMNAMRVLTPGMGSYLNEAYGEDPSWKEDFFGRNYNWLKTVKEKYDPDEAFWCWRCVGSEGWEELKDGRGYGPLCQKNSD